MNIDYTTVFDTPEELADFCMLDVREQERIIADLAAQGAVKDVALSCNLPHKPKKEAHAAL